MYVHVAVRDGQNVLIFLYILSVLLFDYVRMCRLITFCYYNKGFMYWKCAKNQCIIQLFLRKNSTYEISHLYKYQTFIKTKLLFMLQGIDAKRPHLLRMRLFC